MCSSLFFFAGNHFYVVPLGRFPGEHFASKLPNGNCSVLFNYCVRLICGNCQLITLLAVDSVPLSGCRRALAKRPYPALSESWLIADIPVGARERERAQRRVDRNEAYLIHFHSLPLFGALARHSMHTIDFGTLPTDARTFEWRHTHTCPYMSCIQLTTYWEFWRLHRLLSRAVTDGHNGNTCSHRDHEFGFTLSNHFAVRQLIESTVNGCHLGPPQTTDTCLFFFFSGPRSIELTVPWATERLPTHCAPVNVRQLVTLPHNRRAHTSKMFTGASHSRIW